MSRALTGSPSSDDDSLLLTLSAFYREEFLKCLSALRHTILAHRHPKRQLAYR
jgi:hypothetical protein